MTKNNPQRRIQRLGTPLTGNWEYPPRLSTDPNVAYEMEQEQRLAEYQNEDTDYLCPGIPFAP